MWLISSCTENVKSLNAPIRNPSMKEDDNTLLEELVENREEPAVFDAVNLKILSMVLKKHSIH